MTCVSRLGICSVRVSRIFMWFIISLASHSYRPTGYMHAYIHTHRSMPFTRLFSSFFASLSAFSSLYLVLHLKVDLLFLSQCNAQSTRRLISLFLFFFLFLFRFQTQLSVLLVLLTQFFFLVFARYHDTGLMQSISEHHAYRKRT